jgi:hypothetical protein
MAYIGKSVLALGALAAVASLPAPAYQLSLPAPAGKAAPAQPRALAMAQSADASNCFVARKKTAKRKASSHVRLVKICE